MLTDWISGWKHWACRGEHNRTWSWSKADVEVRIILVDISRECYSLSAWNYTWNCICILNSGNWKEMFTRVIYGRGKKSVCVIWLFDCCVFERALHPLAKKDPKLAFSIFGTKSLQTTFYKLYFLKGNGCKSDQKYQICHKIRWSVLGYLHLHLPVYEPMAFEDFCSV